MIHQIMGYGLLGRDAWFTTLHVNYEHIDDSPIPRTWTVERKAHKNDSVQVSEFTLVEYEINPVLDESYFKIDAPPGTEVLNRTYPPESQEFILGEEGKPNLPPGEAILQEEAQRSSYRTLLITVGIALAVICGWAYYRKRIA